MSSSRDKEIIELWLAKQSSPHTRSCYQRDVARILSCSAKSLKDITLADVQRFAQSLEDTGLAPISRARTLAAVKSLFGFCQRIRYIVSNPAAELVLPSYENRLSERIVGELEVRRLLETVEGARDRVLLGLLYAAGSRVSEACGLLWRNVRPRGDSGQITVFGKNGRTRSIALNAGIWKQLAALRGTAGPEQPVFPSRTGRRLDRGRVRVILRRAARLAGVSEPVSPHWLRHAHASHALDHGAPIHLVQATLGHSSVATTSSYLHARPGDSSARFLAFERFSPEPSRIRLPLSPTRAMNVTTANYKRPKEKLIMATFTIDSDNNIVAHASLPAGADASQAFSNPKELAKLTAEWPAIRLVETWNSFAGVTPFDDLKPVKKFKDRKAAVARIWAAVTRLSPDAAQPTPDVAPTKGKAKKSPTKAAGRAQAQKGATESRANKKAEVIALMKRAKGVTLAEIMEATSWQAHTVRGFVSILGSKGGQKIESTKNAAGERSYHITK
jgi:integrase/recombinase XerD